MKRVLVIAAHPDDELLGCGGTLLQHNKAGDLVYVIICCEAVSLRTNAQQQDGYLQNAMEKLHIKKFFSLSFPSQRLDAFPLLDLIRPIERVMEEIRPQIVYTHFRGDSNQDHKRVFDATVIATRPIWSNLEAMYTFYTVSSTEWGRTQGFSPDTWVDITNVMDEKLGAFACYQSEVKEYPHPRSIEALRNVAKYWGNQCLMEYAEAFQTMTRMIRTNGKENSNERKEAI